MTTTFIMSFALVHILSVNDCLCAPLVTVGLTPLSDRLQAKRHQTPLSSDGLVGRAPGTVVEAGPVES
jgi:hypothetical protein